MPTYFQRPENALKRANEFIDVGKKQRALDALYDVIKSKKHRTWQKIHEPIMEKYLELCVELRKSHIAKEGLYQYKNICQQVNIKSLEDVVRRYIALAEYKTEAARQESHQCVLDIDDLDQPDTPESLLLKAVSGENTQDRSDRAILTPWVKFLWESYRQCLDLLRNNSKVEKLYQDIAQQAFKFCLKYSRKTEFRKLCDNLRAHLGLVHKHQHQQTAINLNNPESQAMHLETRLVQLDSAINMELWQEAFKAVEDIHGLISLSKKAPRPSLMANYYMKLGLVFWKSGNQLFHACTLHRHFLLAREQRKNLSQEELQKMASRVLCATLAIPIPASRNAIDTLLEMGEGTLDKQRKLALLLMLQNPPKRQGLVSDLVKHSVLQYVHPELQNLYNLLEVEFHPLRLYQKVKALIDFISQNDDLAVYVPALEDIIVTRVLKQVSQVYQTIDFSKFASLVPFATTFRLERIIVNTARNLELQVRIDHRNHSLSFGTDLGVSQKEDVPEGPYIQRMPSEQIRVQLTQLAETLHKAVRTLQNRDQEHILASISQLQSQKEELKATVIRNYKMTAEKEHARILMRRQTIENRKEELEHLNDQREREEYEQQEEVRRRAMEAEMARLEKEAKERERQRQIAEAKDIQKKHALERIEQLKKSELGARVVQKIDEEDLANMDVDDIMQKQVEQLEKEKKELQERLRNQEKKIDHMARARRSKEIPLLEKQFDEEHVKSRDFWEQQEIERIAKVKEDRELELVTRDRLQRMKKDRQEFIGVLKDKRKKHYKEKLAAFEKNLLEERKKRLADRKEERKAERRNKWVKEREEEKQKAIDEALKREREEKERLEKEQKEQEEKEYEEKLAKLEEIAAKQREREREMEERLARRDEEARREKDRPRDDGPGPRDRDVSSAEPWRRGGPPPEKRLDGPPDKTPWRPQGQTSWREREKEKHESWKKPGSEDTGDRWQRGGPLPDRDLDRRPPDRDLDRRPPERDLDRRPRSEDRVQDDRPPLDDRRPPPDDRFDRRPPDDRIRDDRGPPGGSWRDRERDRGSRDGPAFRDERRDDRDRMPPRDDRGAWRDRGPPRDDGPPPRDSWRDRESGRDRRFDNRDIRLDKEEMGRLQERDRERGIPPRDDRGGGGWRSRAGGDRDDGPGWRRGDGPAPPRDGGRGDSWRDRDRRDDRGPDRGPRDRDDRDFRRGPDRDDRDMRRGTDRDDQDMRRGPPPDRGDRDMRSGPGPSGRDEGWRRGGPPPAREKPREPEKRLEGDDDGWTTVRR